MTNYASALILLRNGKQTFCYTLSSLAFCSRAIFHFARKRCFYHSP